jgi:2'-5' RNA ligase
MNPTSDTRKSALVVVVPETEAVVGRWRSLLDPSAGRGMPAHITVLYPFAPAAMVTDALVARATEVVAGSQAFDFSLPSTGWFDDRVVYLAPDPVEPFLALTATIISAFPDFPPSGAFVDPVPHLTLGRGQDTGRLRAAELDVQTQLPVRSTVREVRLMIRARDTGQWGTRARLALRQ